MAVYMAVRDSPISQLTRQCSAAPSEVRVVAAAGATAHRAGEGGPGNGAAHEVGAALGVGGALAKARVEVLAVLALGLLHLLVAAPAARLGARDVRAILPAPLRVVASKRVSVAAANTRTAAGNKSNGVEPSGTC